MVKSTTSQQRNKNRARDAHQKATPTGTAKPKQFVKETHAHSIAASRSNHKKQSDFSVNGAAKPHAKTADAGLAIKAHRELGSVKSQSGVDLTEKVKDLL